MKPPSMAEFYHHALHSFLRFPLVIASAYGGTFLMIYLVEIMDSGLNPFLLLHVVLSCALGIPLFFAARVFYEKKNLG
jgi:SNF family Na+-dependent transporter